MSKSIVISGVGGQGTLFASKIISCAAQSRGLFVRTSETIGMAQRGGSVCGHIRIDAENLAPVIPSSHADILIAFELAEAVRYLSKLRDSAICVVNTDTIIPTNVALKKGKYLEEEYLQLLKTRFPNGVFISGRKLALQAGDIRTLNVVLLGAAVAAKALPFTEEEIEGAIVNCLRPKLVEMNLKAFRLGMEEAGKLLNNIKQNDSRDGRVER